MSDDSEQLTLLFVEDSENDTLLIVNALKDAGLKFDWKQVDTEPTLRAALAEKTWNLAFCDYVLPNLDALRSLKIIRESQPDLPVIVISGAVGEETAVESLQYGAKDYLSKQNLRRLVPAVQRELQDAAAKRERQIAEAMKRHAEAALRTTGERYRILFERNPTPMWVYDRTDWRILQANEAAIPFFGYTRDEFLSLAVLDLLPPEDVAPLLARVGGLGNEGRSSVQRIDIEKKMAKFFTRK